jgi:hypothetical protein
MPWWAWSRCGILPRASAGSEPSAARLRAQPPLMPVWSPPVATSDCDAWERCHSRACVTGATEPRAPPPPRNGCRERGGPAAREAVELWLAGGRDELGLAADPRHLHLGQRTCFSGAEPSTSTTTSPSAWSSSGTGTPRRPSSTPRHGEVRPFLPLDGLASVGLDDGCSKQANAALNPVGAVPHDDDPRCRHDGGVYVASSRQGLGRAGSSARVLTERRVSANARMVIPRRAPFVVPDGDAKHELTLVAFAVVSSGSAGLSCARGDDG